MLSISKPTIFFANFRSLSLRTFTPEPWVWIQDQPNTESWSHPATLAVSRSWKDVDAFCKYLISSVGRTSLNATNDDLKSKQPSSALFVDVGIRKPTTRNFSSCPSPPFEYILFGNLDAMMLVVHGYPKKLPEMALFEKFLRHGSISKLYWSDKDNTNIYSTMIGKSLERSWCNLSLFFQMLGIKELAQPQQLPLSLSSWISSSNLEMWKRTNPLYATPKLSPSCSEISPGELQYSLSRIFSNISLFRSIIKDAHPNLIRMSPEDEREFAEYYLGDLKTRH